VSAIFRLVRGNPMAKAALENAIWDWKRNAKDFRWHS